jgi:hypothetical protein
VKRARLLLCTPARYERAGPHARGPSRARPESDSSHSSADRRSRCADSPSRPVGVRSAGSDRFQAASTRSPKCDEIDRRGRGRERPRAACYGRDQSVTAVARRYQWRRLSYGAPRGFGPSGPIIIARPSRHDWHGLASLIQVWKSERRPWQHHPSAEAGRGASFRRAAVTSVGRAVTP